MFSRLPQVYTIYHLHTQQPAWRPPTDVYETEAEVIMQIEVAGMRDGHFHLACQDRLLIVYGTRSDRSGERRAYHQMEIHLGDFRTEIELPVAVNTATIRAEYDDGFLRIVLPKVQQ